MKIVEILQEDMRSFMSYRPAVYVDMDGVLADFDAERARISGGTEGKMSPETIEKIKGSNFFGRLEKYPSADALIDLVSKSFGHYFICSSPMPGDEENSIKWKNIWLSKHITNFPPKKKFFTAEKEQYARQADGTPNILIDDKPENIEKWNAAGGIGIQYHAGHDSLRTVISGLKNALGNIRRGKHQKKDEYGNIQLNEAISQRNTKFLEILEEVLPYIMKKIGLKELPPIKLIRHVPDEQQPTFGQYNNHKKAIFLGIENRHPMDIVRTLAHELVHHKQDLLGELGPHSGRTGSPAENEANVVAGIIMRHLNKRYPEFLLANAIELE